MPVTGSILIVDDDPDLLHNLHLRLKLEGYAVRAAPSAEQALTLLSAERPDLVVTDLRMGGMDGLGLFAAIQELYPRLPVIILTAHGTIPEAVASTRLGVFGFLTKPYDAHTLLAEVARALEQSRLEGGNRDQPAWRSQIVTRSPALEAILDEVAIVAPTDAPVLINGETGTGKELLAQAVHDASHRRERAFVAVNCGAIPEALLESELFGHVKGSFTGATRDHEGLFRSAQGGTVFLDEIGDMPLPLQVKLLRVLQEREVRPVGGLRPIRIDARIIAATHRDLDAAIRDGAFREDLLYRLNVVQFTLPPLRERPEDVGLLAQRFVVSLANKYGRTIVGLAPDALERLVRAQWPGNVRQLYNVVEKCVALTTAPLVALATVERALARGADAELPSMDEARRAFERDYLTRLLRTTAGNVTQAARLAKRNRTDFYDLLKRHDLEAAAFKRID